MTERDLHCPGADHFGAGEPDCSEPDRTASGLDAGASIPDSDDAGAFPDRDDAGAFSDRDDTGDFDERPLPGPILPPLDLIPTRGWTRRRFLLLAGSLVTVASAGTTLLLLNRAERGPGSVAATLTGHTGPVLAVAWSPDGTQIATGSSDGTARIWDADRALVRHTLPAGALRRLAWSPDGALLATVDNDGAVRLWDAARGELACDPYSDSHSDPDSDPDSDPYFEPVSDLAWAPDGLWLGTTSYSGAVAVIQPQASCPGDAVQILGTCPGGALALSWSDPPLRLAAVGADGTAPVWRLDTGELLFTASHAVGQTTRPGGNIERTPNPDGRPDGDRPLARSPHPITSVAFSPGGRWLTTASGTGVVRMWNATDGSDAGVVAKLGPSVRSVAWSPDGSRLVAVAEHGTAQVWEAARPEARHELPGVASVAWSPDSARLATTSLEASAAVWDATTGAVLHRLTADSVAAVAWSPDGSHIVTASHDGVARIWRL